MKVAIFPGSFDPITMGHIDIIKRASLLFDKLIILVSTNTKKKYTFTDKEKVDFIKKSTSDIPNVEVDIYNGLVTEYARIHNINYFIKGLRNSIDFEYESQFALMNKYLNSNTETIFMRAEDKYVSVSSSLIKEIIKMNGNVDDFLPPEILEQIKNKLNKD